MSISGFEKISLKNSEARHARLENARELDVLRQALAGAKPPPTLLASLDALAGEGQRELFQEGLLRTGLAGCADGCPAAAAVLFAYLKEKGATPEIRQRAAEEEAVLRGSAAPGRRAESLLVQFTGQAGDFRTVLPMLVGSAVGGAMGTIFMSRLSSSAAQLLTRGQVARALAGVAALGVEVPVFTLVSRLLHGASGASLEADFMRSGLSLGILKVAGRWGAPGLVGGMLGAHELEARWGLRPRSDFSSSFVDALGSVASLAIGARLGRGLLGPRWAAWEQELRLRAETKAPPSGGTIWGESLRGLAPDALPAGVRSSLKPWDFQRPSLVLMSAGEPGDGPGSKPVPVSPLAGSVPPPADALSQIREALHRSGGDDRKLLSAITQLMRMTFDAGLPKQVRDDAGRLLFNGSYFRVWQELLIHEADGDFRILATLTEPMLRDAAEKCLAGLEGAVAKGDYLAAARLIGPLVYIAFRTLDNGLQTKLEKVLVENPTPLLRLPALIHDYAGMKMSMLRVIQWGRYERLLIFNDLLSGDLSRLAFGKAILKRMDRAERESGTKVRSIEELLRFASIPVALLQQRVEYCPEYCIHRSGTENQIRASFSLPLLDLIPEKRDDYVRRVLEAVEAKIAAMHLLDLRDLFLDQGLMIIPQAAPLRTIVATMSEQAALLVREGRWTQAEGKAFVLASRRIVRLLNEHFYSGGRTENEDFLYFPDPFSN